MRVGKERKLEWMKESMYEWMNENKRGGKKKYETKNKTFSNELMIICFLTVARTLEKGRDALPASEIVHLKCERDEVVVLQESSFLWRPLFWNNLTSRPFDKTQARAHAHPHTYKSGTLCSVQRVTSFVITFHVQNFLSCYQNEQQISI